jgi:hypothetical protein
MTRQIGTNRVKLQSYVILTNNNVVSNKDSNDSQSVFLVNEKKVQVNNNGKDLTFDFDKCFTAPPTNEDNASKEEKNESSIVPADLISILGNAIDLVLLGYSSTVLCYCSQTAQKISSSSFPITHDPLYQLTEQLTRSLFKKIEIDERNSSSMSEFAVEMICFELIDNQFRDLKSGNSNDIRIKESEEALSIVGVHSFQCKDSDQLMEVLKDCLTKRLLMISGQFENNSSSLSSKKRLTPQELNLLQPTLLGYLGNIVIQLVVHSYQTILLPSSSSLSTKNEQIRHKVHRKASLNLVWLNTADNLISMMESSNFKAFPDYQSLSHSSFEWLNPNSIASSSTNSSNPTAAGNTGTDLQSRQIQLKNSLKSLSTLTRVVTSLMERNHSSETTNTATVAAGNDGGKKMVHIPFRDSMLTRLLKNVLNGNCFLSMITVPPRDNIEGTSRSLRFASQIGKLYNLIWINEELLLRQKILLPIDSNEEPDKVNPLVAEEKKEENDQISETFNHFANLENEMNEQMGLLAAELDRLESLRWNTLESLSLQLLPVKIYGDSKSSIAFIQESFEKLQKNDVNDEKKEMKEGEDSIALLQDRQDNCDNLRSEKASNQQKSVSSSVASMKQSSYSANKDSNSSTNLSLSPLKSTRTGSLRSIDTNDDIRKPLLSPADRSALIKRTSDSKQSSVVLSRKASLSKVVIPSSSSGPSGTSESSQFLSSSRRAQTAAVAITNPRNHGNNSSLKSVRQIKPLDSLSASLSEKLPSREKQKDDSLEATGDRNEMKELHKQEDLLEGGQSFSEKVQVKRLEREKRLPPVTPPSSSSAMRRNSNNGTRSSEKKILPTSSASRRPPEQQRLSSSPVSPGSLLLSSKRGNLDEPEQLLATPSTEPPLLNSSGSFVFPNLSQQSDQNEQQEFPLLSTPPNSLPSIKSSSSLLTTTLNGEGEPPGGNSFRKYKSDLFRNHNNHSTAELLSPSSPVVVKNPDIGDPTKQERSGTESGNDENSQVSDNDEQEAAEDDGNDHSDERKNRPEGDTSEDNNSGLLELQDNDKHRNNRNNDNNNDEEDDDSDLEDNPIRQAILKELEKNRIKSGNDLLPPILRTNKKMADKEEDLMNSLFKSKKRKNRKKEEEEIDPEDDDGLSDLERMFLRSVSTGNMQKVQSCLHQGVNINVKNSFERLAQFPNSLKFIGFDNFFLSFFFS